MTLPGTLSEKGSLAIVELPVRSLIDDLPPSGTGREWPFEPLATDTDCVKARVKPCYTPDLVHKAAKSRTILRRRPILTTASRCSAPQQPQKMFFVRYVLPADTGVEDG